MGSHGRSTISVRLKNGEVLSTSHLGATEEEVTGWEHMLTTTVPGEGLADVGVALLVDDPFLNPSSAKKVHYIRADFIASVTIT